MCAHGHVRTKRERETFATAFGGNSPLSFGSTHCLTLSSLSLGVAYLNNKCNIIRLSAYKIWKWYLINKAKQDKGSPKWQDSAALLAWYDQQVFFLSKALGELPQSCKHHFSASAVQSWHICEVFSWIVSEQRNFSTRFAQYIWCILHASWWL